MTISDPFVKVCPQCGFENDEQEAFCNGCGGSLQAVDPQPKGSGNAVGISISKVTIKLLHLDLGTYQPTGEEITLPEQDRVVIGRSKGTFTPDVDLKKWLVPYIDKDGARNYGISRENAEILKVGPTTVIVRSSNASVGIWQWPQGDRALGRPIHDGEQIPLLNGDVYQLGDVFKPGAKEKAPGLLFKIVVEH